MEKMHTYYGKSMSTNFPSSPHMMSFIAFSCTLFYRGNKSTRSTFNATILTV